MGKMRSSKYDVTTAYGLCQDYLPPDGALCTVTDYVIMSQCAHNKAIHLAADGTVSVTDISQIQNITIVGLPDYVNNEFKIALYAKETQRYLCFNDNWRLVGMKELRTTCYFNETIVHGYFVFRSVADLQRRVGFTHRGKPVGPKKNANDACYMFTKIDAEQFFHQHMRPKWRETAAILAQPATTAATSQRQRQRQRQRQQQQQQQQHQHQQSHKCTNNKKGLRKKNCRRKSNNQNQKLQQQPQQQQQQQQQPQQQQYMQGHNSSSLSNTKKQLDLVENQQQQQQQQHPIRHHHDDPTLLARRQHHNKNPKRRHKQQQRVAASPTSHTTARGGTTAIAARTSTKLTTAEDVASQATTATTATHNTTLAMTMGNRQMQQLRAAAAVAVAVAAVTSTAATSSTEDLLAGSMSTGYEDIYNNNSSSSSSSSSSNEPWATWFVTPTAAIDKLTSDVLLTTTADSIKPSMLAVANTTIDPWSTFITELETEAALATTTSAAAAEEPAAAAAAVATSSSDNVLLQHVPQLVSVEHSDSDELLTTTAEAAEATILTATIDYETKVATPTNSKMATTTSTTATSASNSNVLLPSAPTTISTTAAGSNALVERTPLAATVAPLTHNMLHATNSASTTAMATAISSSSQTDNSQSTIHKLSRDRNSGSNDNDNDNDRAQQQPSKVLPYRQQLTATTASSNRLLAEPTMLFTQGIAAKAATAVTLDEAAVATPPHVVAAHEIIDSNHLGEATTSSIATAAATTAATSTFTAASAITSTTKKSLRKSTQKLIATPYHQLTYVRDNAGDIDIDNLDNISMYPDLYDGEPNEFGNYSSKHDSSSSSSSSSTNSRLTFVSGYLPTAAATSTLPESIRIGMMKISAEIKRLRQQQQQQQQKRLKFAFNSNSKLRVATNE